MFVAHYRFDGDPAALAAAYERMLAAMPTDAITLQVGVRTDAGLEVWDACPDRAAFEAFAASDGLRAGLEAAGLPWPTITALGPATAALAAGSRLA